MNRWGYSHPLGTLMVNFLNTHEQDVTVTHAHAAVFGSMSRHHNARTMGWLPTRAPNIIPSARDMTGELPRWRPHDHPLHEPLDRFMDRILEGTLVVFVGTRCLPWNFQLPSTLQDVTRLSAWTVSLLIGDIIIWI